MGSFFIALRIFSFFFSFFYFFFFCWAFGEGESMYRIAIFDEANERKGMFIEEKRESRAKQKILGNVNMCKANSKRLWDCRALFGLPCGASKFSAGYVTA